MANMLQYRCPNCGGQIEFSTKEQKLTCPYCDSTFDVEDVIQHEQFENQQDNTDWDDYDEPLKEGELLEYGCSNCGGTVLCEPTTAATTCPYCDSPIVMTGRVSGTLRPEFVLPFKLDKNQAVAAMKEHLKGKLLLPKDFRSEHKLQEIKGMYVPFWLFDCDASTYASYHATKTKHWRDSTYEYTRTEHYKLLRSGEFTFDKIPVDGSVRMPDNYMEAVEPYDYKALTGFDPGYLAGFMADRYDVDAVAARPRANKRITESAKRELEKTISGYSSHTIENMHMNYANQKTHYALMPVWMLTAKYGDKNYLFAMNGQTGKFIGELPISWKRFWLTFLVASLACSPLVYLIILLIMMFI